MAFCGCLNSFTNMSVYTTKAIQSNAVSAVFGSGQNGQDQIPSGDPFYTCI